MLGPSRAMISAPATMRLRIDSAMTASWSDLYQSGGSNCEVTRVDPRPSRAARMPEQLRRGVRGHRGGQEVVQNQQVAVVQVGEEVQPALRGRLQHGEPVGQVVEAEEPRGVVLSARGIEKRLGEVGLAHAGLAEHDEITSGVDPLTAGKTCD